MVVLVLLVLLVIGVVAAFFIGRVTKDVPAPDRDKQAQVMALMQRQLAELRKE
jgi:hypothetical protein